MKFTEYRYIQGLDPTGHVEGLSHEQMQRDYQDFTNLPKKYAHLKVRKTIIFYIIAFLCTKTKQTQSKNIFN